MSRYCPSCLANVEEGEWGGGSVTCPGCGNEIDERNLLSRGEAREAARNEQGDRDYHRDADEGRE